MTTTKQAAWDIEKANNHQFLKESRGVAVTIAEVRKHTRCTCVHTMKHHKKTGTCKKDCGCAAGVR